MKKIIAPVILIAFVIVGIAAAKDMLAKTTVQNAARAATGLELKIQKLHLGIMSSLVDIRGLQLLNPRGFQDRVMFDLPEIFLNIKILELFGGKIHVEEAKLNVAEITIVKNADGKLNLDSLKPKSKAREEAPAKPAEPAKPGEPKKAGKAPQIVFDRLELKIGRAVYKDYSKGGQPVVETFEINLNETHTNVTNIQVLIPLIMARVLTNTAIGRLAGVDMNQFVGQFDLEGANLDELGLDQFEGILKGMGDGAQGGTEKAVEGVKNFFGQLGEAAK